MTSATQNNSLYLQVDCEIIDITDLTPGEKLFRVRQTYGAPLKNSKNVALLNGIMYVIITEGLSNREFIADRTVNYGVLAGSAADRYAG